MEEGWGAKARWTGPVCYRNAVLTSDPAPLSPRAVTTSAGVIILDRHKVLRGLLGPKSPSVTVRSGSLVFCAVIAQVTAGVRR
jgi:hypothetical protein